MAWKVTKYVKENGKCPFDKWKAGLTVADRAAIDDAVLALETTDIIPPETVKKYLTTNLHEFKIKGNKKQLRPLVERNNKTKEITIFGGAIEKGRIPKGDIETSENLRKDYLSGDGCVRDYWQD